MLKKSLFEPNALVQCFFAWRVHVISGRWFISILAWSGSLARVGVTLTICILTTQEGTISRFEKKYPSIIIISLSVAMVIDLLNTCSICYYLHTMRTGFKATDALVDQIMAWAIETGLLTSVCAVLMLILDLSAPQWNIWTGMLMFYAKLYSYREDLCPYITLPTYHLESLNGRSLLRDKNSVFQTSFSQNYHSRPEVHINVAQHSATDALEMTNVKSEIRRSDEY
ncbi:hypothetical protein C8J56DRAFT_1118448 [Mycena floridula]|nr:hypothetical protein C8J56DRAFT_1118448 [Mycena floridula]